MSKHIIPSLLLPVFNAVKTYIDTAVNKVKLLIPTSNQGLANDAGYITDSALEPYAKTADIARDYATKNEVQNQIDDLVDGASSAADTLKKLEDLLGGDKELLQTLQQAILNKADKTEIEELKALIGDLSGEDESSIADLIDELKSAIESKVSQEDYNKDKETFLTKTEAASTYATKAELPEEATEEDVQDLIAIFAVD